MMTIIAMVSGIGQDCVKMLSWRGKTCQQLVSWRLSKSMREDWKSSDDYGALKCLRKSKGDSDSLGRRCKKPSDPAL
eukprot:4979124-Amphidinium_carterae.1